MIAAGYLYKRVESKPGWLSVSGIDDIYSVSGCVSEDFCDYIPHWRHNGFWLFDSLAVMNNLAEEQALSLKGFTPFFYKIYPLQWEEKSQEWEAFEPDSSFETNVELPEKAISFGFDIVTFTAQTNPECSPLSCNSLAEEVAVNRHCLLDDFESARAIVEGGLLKQAERGPYRILEVHTL